MKDIDFLAGCHRIRVYWRGPSGREHNLETVISPDEFDRLLLSKNDSATKSHEKREMRGRWCKMMGERFAYLLAEHFDKFR